jgi:hypothetical protein
MPNEISKKIILWIRNNELILIILGVGLSILLGILFKEIILSIIGVVLSLIGIVPIIRSNKEHPIKLKPIPPPVDHLIIRTFFKKLCDKYKERKYKILVVGDVMLDHKMKGDIPIFSDVESHQVNKGDFMLGGKDKESKTPGGASNVAWAFSKVSDVTLIGVISSDSSDYEGKTLKERCKENFTFDPVEIPGILTTTKIYFEYPDQQGKTGVQAVPKPTS